MHLGIANPQWREKRFRHSWCMRNPHAILRIWQEVHGIEQGIDHSGFTGLYFSKRRVIISSAISVLRDYRIKKNRVFMFLTTNSALQFLKNLHFFPSFKIKNKNKTRTLSINTSWNLSVHLKLVKTHIIDLALFPQCDPFLCEYIFCGNRVRTCFG